jgi:hypothetical protein
VETIGIFIAVVVVLVAMDVFFFLILWGMVATVRRFARNNALRQAGILDELIYNKEETLQGLEQQIIKRRAQLSDMVTVQPEAAAVAFEAPDYQTIATGFYKDADFIDEYRTLRGNFVFDNARVVRETLERIPVGAAGSDERAFVAQSILDVLGSEDIYQLSTLPDVEQVRLLREEFTAAQTELLDEFLTAGTYFECYEFVNWLRQYIFENGTRVLVRTSHEGEDFGFLDSRVATSYDDTLCEGISIRAKGRLYDFSIRNREIVG